MCGDNVKKIVRVLSNAFYMSVSRVDGLSNRLGATLERINVFALRVFPRDGAKFRGRTARLSKIPLGRIVT